MRQRSLYALLILHTLAATAVFAQNMGDIKLPTWPQSFALSAGGGASFGFPVMKAGKVVVDVTWTGKPLSVVLLDWHGTPVSDAALRTSPVHIEVDAANVDPSKGFIWTVAISDPGKAPAAAEQAVPVANGQIKVQYPDVDLAQFTNLAGTLSTRRLSTRRAEQDRLAASLRAGQAPRVIAQDTNLQLEARIKSLQQTEAAQFAAAAESIKTRIGALPKTGPVSPGASSVLPKSPLVQRVGRLPDIAQEKPEIITPPVLTKLINLNIVYAGDEGWVRVRDVPQDMSLTQICFQMTPTAVAKAEIISTSRVNSDPQYGPHVVFKIRVPEEVPNMQDMTGAMPVFARNVSAKNPDAYADGNRNRTVVYVCRRSPRIDKVSSMQVGPSQDIVLTGSYFRGGSKVHFTFPDGRDEVRTNPDANNWQQIKTYTPGYRSASAFPVILYIDDVIGGRPVRSNMVQLTFLATLPVATSITPTHTAPNGQDGDWIAIKGTGLKKITGVHFEPDPGQESKIFTQRGSNLDFRNIWGTPGGIDTECYPRPGATGGISESVTGKLMAHLDYSDRDIIPLIPFTMDPFKYSRPLLEPCRYPGTVFSKKDGDDSHSQTVNTTDPCPEKHWPAYIWTTAWHHSSLFSGHGGDDIYVVDVVLKNGWTFESVKFSASHNESGKGARLVGFWVDSNGRPNIKVHWWVDAPNNDIWYCITPNIHGPRFVPYM